MGTVGVAIGDARNLQDVSAIGYYVSKVNKASYIGFAIAIIACTLAELVIGGW
ncbi:MAG: hypothetical protein QXZ22_02460 [Sulfolobales archaeon]